MVPPWQPVPNSGAATEPGTKILKHFVPGALGGSPDGFTRLGKRTTLFAAYDTDHSNELWRTDGTTKGTKLVKDINSSDGSYPYRPVKFKKKLYFAALQDLDGKWDLWRTDGTANGTKMFKRSPGLYSVCPFRACE